MNWLLLIVILFFAANLVWGHRQGFLRVLFSLGGWILVLAFIVCTSPHISQYLYEHTKIPAKIEERCTRELQESVEEAMEERAQELQDSETGGGELLREIGIMLPTVLVEKMLTDSGTYEQLSQDISSLAVKGISYVVALVAALVLYALIQKIIKWIDKIPIIGGINRQLGVIAGGIKALIILWVFFAITATFAGTDWGRFILSYVYEAPILLWFYEHNLVLDTFAAFF